MIGTHKLDMLTNSISYFQEAVSYAQVDEPEAYREPQLLSA